MSILRLWRHALVLVVSCLSLNAMAAPRLITSGSGDTLKLMGVKDIVINDIFYNVSFGKGDCKDIPGAQCGAPLYGKEPLAHLAEAALSSAAFGSGNLFSHQPMRINGCSDPDNCTLETVIDHTFSCHCFPYIIGLTISADPTKADTISTYDVSQGNEAYPNYTNAYWWTQPVPEPTGWAMYGIGMIALGGMARRRSASKKTS